LLEVTRPDDAPHAERRNWIKEFIRHVLRRSISGKSDSPSTLPGWDDLTIRRVSSALLHAGPTRVRNAGNDALRVGTTFLVVLHHTAITYGAIGGWYYKEVPTDGSLSSMVLVFFCTFNQAGFMGMLFLLAGYYTPASLETKGSLNFLRDRLRRLGVPPAGLRFRNRTGDDRTGADFAWQAVPGHAAAAVESR